MTIETYNSEKFLNDKLSTDGKVKHYQIYVKNLMPYRKDIAHLDVKAEKSLISNDIIITINIIMIDGIDKKYRRGYVKVSEFVGITEGLAVVKEQVEDVLEAIF